MLIFPAPYVDVFKTSYMGVTIRFNEVFGRLLCLTVVFHVLKTRQQFQLGLFDIFVLGLLVAMASSLVANLGNLPSADRLGAIPTAWIGVEGVMDMPKMATYKKLAQVAGSSRCLSP